MKVSLFQLLVSCFAGLTGYMLYNGSWFSYHPLFMILGFIGCMGNAIFVEHYGASHWTHVFLQYAGLACVDFAWYVIWTNKNAMNKNHNTTWHAWVGLGALIFTNLQCLLSSFSMWPNKSAIARANNRNLHILSGQATFIIALAATSLGWYKLKSSNMVSLLWFNASLIIIAILLLTRLANFAFVRTLTKNHKIL